MEVQTPARLYCLLAGAALVIAGIGGFFYDASFATGSSIDSELELGILAVNGWHNLLHILLGCGLLVAAGEAARAGAIAAGAAFVALAVLGFIATGDGGGIGFVARGDALFELVPVNDGDNVVHLILGAAGLVAGLATRGSPGSAPASGRA